MAERDLQHCFGGVLGRPGRPRSKKVKKAHWILTILGSILDHFGTILGVRCVMLWCGVVRCVTLCREKHCIAKTWLKIVLWCLGKCGGAGGCKKADIAETIASEA